MVFYGEPSSMSPRMCLVTLTFESITSKTQSVRLPITVSIVQIPSTVQELSNSQDFHGRRLDL